MIRTVLVEMIIALIQNLPGSPGIVYTTLVLFNFKAIFQSLSHYASFRKILVIIYSSTLKCAFTRNFDSGRKLSSINISRNALDFLVFV